MGDDRADASLERSLAWRRLAGALFGEAGDASGDAAPLEIDGFVILGVLGRGAMGTVYRARDERLDREVAIKVLRVGDGDAAVGERLVALAEARALAQVSHPAVVTAYAVGERGPWIYIVMERVDGETLGRWQRAPGRRWREIVAVYLEVARGLQAAHDRGIVHRDLKPDNVVVDGEGRPRILDFGLAQGYGGAAAARVEVAGTPAYMAPEQRRGAPPAPTMDQYAFAAALHEALFGELPARAGAGAGAGEAREANAAREAPAALRAALDRALAEAPERRWPSLRALGQAIERAVAAGPGERARLLLLDRVEASWIDGVLARPGDAAGELRFDRDRGRARPELVDARRAGARAEVAAAAGDGASIAALAASGDGSLLLVGGPGSGKTTALLTLARAALRRARVDPTSPAPVVLGLASWAAWVDAGPRRDAALRAWLAAELRDKYGIPRRLAAAWIADDALLLLLDGLDEVAPARREACVRALAEHRGEHLAPMIVSARTSVCEALAAADLRLPLGAAVELGPLAPAQVELLLSRGGEDFAGLRAAFAGDLELRALLVASPLLLDIAAQAFRGRPPAALVGVGSSEELRRRIWSAYVARALERRPAAALERQLAWIARRLDAVGAAEIWIERLQPTWLERPVDRALFTAATLVATGLGAALLIGALLGLATSPAIALPTAALAGSALALFVGLTLGVGAIAPLERLAWSWRAMAAGIPRALGRGVLLALAIAAIAALVWGAGESTQLVVALFVGNLVAYAGLFGLMLVVLAGLVGAAPSPGWRPNQGIANASRNARMVGGIVAASVGAPMLAVTLLVGAASPEALLAAQAAPSDAFREAAAIWSASPLRFFVAVELCVALTLGYVAALLRGGFAVVQHAVLRLLLTGRGDLPRDLVGLLEAASERALLQRIGGGYRFVHAGLREHLAGGGAAAEVYSGAAAPR
ncbi:MAG: serine/threonine-protein kinase [Nannocystaceae bacterium]